MKLSRKVKEIGRPHAAVVLEILVAAEASELS
jgi:hypothetical protein